MGMRSVRARRRGGVDLRHITIGDWTILTASVLTLASLFMPWFNTSVPRPHGEWAFSYSEVISILVIVLFLITLFLVLYPALGPQFGFGGLPFATPLVFLLFGCLLMLMFTYELGKYDCIQCQGMSRGFGVWVGWVASWLYLLGSIIKWGASWSGSPSRTDRRAQAPIEGEAEQW